MTSWVRFSRAGQVDFGALEDETIHVYRGNMFDRPEPIGEAVALSDVQLLVPTRPSKMIALWNNFRELGAKLGVAPPSEPLYLLKAPSCFTDPGTVIRKPSSHDGKVVYEGELGIVIGRTCREVSPDVSRDCIFGYTCVNDVTAADIISKDPTFAQWVRAKSFDGFGPFGPAVVTGIDPSTLRVRTILNGAERQNYPISDMVFPAEKLVSHLSFDMTLLPGDVICCGTSVGVGSMKDPSNVVEITIDGVGTLRNEFVQG